MSSELLSQTNPARDPLLLILEDEPDDFILLRRALQQARLRARIVWAKSGREALDVLRRLQPEVGRISILSDVQLRGEDGFAFLQAVRALPLPQPVGFAFLTGHTDVRTRHRAYSSGADAFFTKPVQFSDLKAIALELENFVGGEPRSETRDGRQENPDSRLGVTSPAYGHGSRTFSSGSCHSLPGL